MITAVDISISSTQDSEQQLKNRLEKVNTHIAGIATSHRQTATRLEELQKQVKRLHRSRSRSAKKQPHIEQEEDNMPLQDHTHPSHENAHT
jgi:chaperonin cofactor prefoldin